jgi:hypothetical protein
VDNYLNYVEKYIDSSDYSDRPLDQMTAFFYEDNVNRWTPEAGSMTRAGALIDASRATREHVRASGDTPAQDWEEQQRMGLGFSASALFDDSQIALNGGTGFSLKSPSSSKTGGKRSPEEILMPGGQPPGKSGITKGVQELPSEVEVKRIFQELTVVGELTPKASYSGVVYNLPNGGAVGLRMSKGWGWTIEIMGVPGVTYTKIHLP